MKNIFMSAVLGLIITLFAVSSADALPKCTPAKTGAGYVGSWRKMQGQWELAFGCTNGETAKVGIEGVIDIQQDFGIFYIMKPDGTRDGEDFYNDACEAITEYCETANSESVIMDTDTEENIDASIDETEEEISDYMSQPDD